MKFQSALFALAFASLPLSGQAAKAPEAPKTLRAVCLAFTWSDDGSVEPRTLLPGTTIDFELNKRIETFRTEHAIYQAVWSSAAPEQVYVDVLRPDGVRIAASRHTVAIGPGLAEPKEHVQYECFPRPASWDEKKKD
jgi:hypothetical protein